MRRTLLLAVLALAAAGCPDDLAQRCPPESLPSGHYTLTTTVVDTPDECLVVRSADGGPPPKDGSILLSRESSTDSILCAGNSDAGPTVYLIVANSSVVRQTPLDPDGGFAFLSTQLQAPSLCSCTTDVNETISGLFLGGGSSGFGLGADGGLEPQPTGINGSIVQTLSNPDGGPCLCDIPCALHYMLSGTPNR